MAKLKLERHEISRDWCKGCGVCVAFCPRQVLELDRQDKVAAVRRFASPAPARHYRLPERG